ncbi:unnamed protein product [Discula destructiva]
MEQHIVARNPQLGGALVIGAQRFQAALLIELAAASAEPLSTSQQAALIEKIWPSIQEANDLAPAHARVEKGLVLVTTPDRPLIRAGKGTIQRGASLAQYAAEIDALYRNANLGMEDDIASGHSLEFGNGDAVARFVRETVSAVTGWTELNRDSSNFFDRGMDSLQALQLTRALRRRLYRPDLGLPTIYKNPTMSQLTAAVLVGNDKDTDRDIMEPLLKTYKELIAQIPKSELFGDAKRTKPVDVVLTGSTGTLGTFILRSLLDRTGVGHVFCLNRGGDGGRASQEIRSKAAGLPTHDLDQRVTFLKTDLASPHLGLEEAEYDNLRTRIGLIIHNAWLVNFNLGLPAFRLQLAGVVNLFSLAAAAASGGNRPHFVFISSVGAIEGHSSDTGFAPEKIVLSMGAPFSNGYARSKFLSELLCEAAAQCLHLPVTIARVGQVAGAVRRPGGIWNRAEWFPSLVVSSMLRLGCLPDTLGRRFSEIDWVPSDLLADVVVDLATRGDLHGGARVFNLRNPHTATWEALLPVILDAAERYLGHALEVVSPSTWLARLRDSECESYEDGDAEFTFNPAVKLLTFYRQGLWGQIESNEPQRALKPMDIENSLAASPILRSVQAVNQDWLRKWVDEWVAASGLVQTGSKQDTSRSITAMHHSE